MDLFSILILSGMGIIAINGVANICSKIYEIRQIKELKQIIIISTSSIIAGTSPQNFSKILKYNTFIE